MIATTNIEDVVSVEVKRASRQHADGSPYFWIEFLIKTGDGSTVEITAFSDEPIQTKENGDAS